MAEKGRLGMSECNHRRCGQEIESELCWQCELKKLRTENKKLEKVREKAEAYRNKREHARSHVCSESDQIEMGDSWLALKQTLDECKGETMPEPTSMECEGCDGTMHRRSFLEMREPDHRMNVPHEHRIEVWFCKDCKYLEFISDKGTAFYDEGE